ncbi:PREDICTED: sulfotransferase family cytosolic 2B member 1-like [Gekko japonicus]|uniref:Sulfotransferase n=1 Tax=Gekko japonicus TaxID=146911 RepID=A0ABM1KW76_GEKJA|nr:PREDICTED: sulfotransferase family cytosolic 2B member 1-like [Gekko japonicus]
MSNSSFTMPSVEYLSYKGVPFPHVAVTEESLDQMENEFRFLNDDVAIVTYPKSGTIWMSEILGLIRQKGDPAWTHSLPMWDRSPWIETSLGLKIALRSPPPRVLCSHVQFQLFPKSFLQSNAKIIYTLRNPKDVLISFYYFSMLSRLFKDPGTLEEFMEEFLSGNVAYGSWFDHVKGWMALKGRPNFFYITYEELWQDLRGSVEKICHFLGKELNSQQIDSVVEYASFRKMKENKMSNFSLIPDHLMDHKRGTFMRKGICGDWKNHLTVPQNKYFDRVYQEKMWGMNTTFPWD